ncbi:hypothetical protein PVAP13_6KG241800 [Panicum virgatum]|uniref:Uncharacterized protein n=1 Tax=Panicum virgatum TaxID=38727 RepID=A0A8T0RD43_PANVG|nr:hypothetical protein PVAP13_6KG241800 [Panicum virgatum]
MAHAPGRAEGFPRSALTWQLLIWPDGHLAGAQRHRPGAGPPGYQLPRRRLHRRPHARRRLRLAPDDLQPGLHPGRVLRRAARARHLPRRRRVAARLPRRRGRQRRAGRAHVALRRRPARQVQDRRLGGGGSRGAAPGRPACPRGAHVPDHRRAGDRGDHPLVRAQLLRHVARARGVHALGDQRHHGALPLRHGPRRALRRRRRGPRRPVVPQRRQDRAGADQLRVRAPARRRPVARAVQRPVHRRRARRRLLRHGLRHLLERLLHQQPHFRGDCAGEGEDDGLRTGQVLRSRVRVVCASHRWCSCRARVRLQAGLFRHERGHGQRECGSTGQSGLHRDRRAHGHLLPHLHLPLLHVPARQGAYSEGASDGVS